MKMNSHLTIVLVGIALASAGCATKGYVRNTIQPVDQKVDQVDQASKQRDTTQTANLDKTNQVVEQNGTRLDATTEIAKSADSESRGAMNKADQNSKELGDLRGVISNIDDYKPTHDATVVHFGVNKSTLSKEEMAKLDEVAAEATKLQRYFITIEGFTDQTGSKTYNDQLSRERANQVISYLVGTHDIPVYRIHMVGLGEQKLIDNGKGKDARQASRRVEISIMSAESLHGQAVASN
jgi:outer membrane protein OmpA-like peptidoglycan-associated protein